MNHATAIALLDEWYVSPETYSVDYWEDLLREIETFQCVCWQPAESFAWKCPENTAWRLETNISGTR